MSSFNEEDRLVLRESAKIQDHEDIGFAGAIQTQFTEEFTETLNRNRQHLVTFTTIFQYGGPVDPFRLKVDTDLPRGIPHHYPTVKSVMDKWVREISMDLYTGANS